MATFSRQIAIFWDVESCPPLPDTSGYDIVNHLRRATIPFGHLTSIKAYIRSSTIAVGQVQVHTLKRELQLAGVQIVEAYDGQLEGPGDAPFLVGDIFSHSMDQTPASIMLITTNSNLSYPLAMLRNRRLALTLVAPLERVDDSLKYQATTTLDWYTDVLGRHPQDAQHSTNRIWVDNSHQPGASTSSIESFSSSRDEAREEDRNGASKGPGVVQRLGPLTVMNVTHTTAEFQPFFGQPAFPDTAGMNNDIERSTNAAFRPPGSWRGSSSSTLRSKHKLSRSRSPSPVPPLPTRSDHIERPRSRIDELMEHRLAPNATTIPFYPPGPPRDLPLNEDKLAQPCPRWPVHANALTRGFYAEQRSPRDSPDFTRRSRMSPQRRQAPSPHPPFSHRRPFLLRSASPPLVHNAIDLSVVPHPDSIGPTTLKSFATHVPAFSPPPPPPPLPPRAPKTIDFDIEGGASAQALLQPPNPSPPLNNDLNLQPFLPLIARLQALRKTGRDLVSASDAGGLKGDKKRMYQAVGVSSFTQYLDAARRAGIVELEVTPSRETLVRLIIA